MTSKSLSVFGNDGAGKKTLLGSLIYKCGLGLPQLEKLERRGIYRLEDIVPFYKETGQPLSFEAPSGLFVAENAPTPDVVFWVVDAANSASWPSSAQGLASSLSTSMLQPPDKVIILVNKMDLVSWSERTFKEIVRVFDTASLNDRTCIIPISSFGGENVLTTPEEPSWVKSISSSQYEGSKLVSGQSLMDLLA